MTRTHTPLAYVVILAAALSTAVCADTPSAAGQTPAAPGTPAGPDPVVAEIGGRKVTLAEVDAKWQEFDAAERARVTQALYQNRRNMLDQLIGDTLVEEAAKKAGVAVDVYVAQETAKRVQPVTEPEIKLFFDQNQDRAQGRAFDQLRADIKGFLEGQRELQARAQVVGELRKANSSIRVMLDPPRQVVEVKQDDPVRGPVNAPITIIEYSDYQCPFCARVTPTLAKLQQTYGDKVRIVFKDFPLPNHAQAPKASEAAHCAGEQGKYWELHDHMFANQRALEVPSLKQYAGALKLDQAAFDQCLDSGKWAEAIRADLEEGEKLGVNSTPTLYINGRPLVGAQPFEMMQQVVEEELARGK